MVLATAGEAQLAQPKPVQAGGQTRTSTKSRSSRSSRTSRRSKSRGGWYCCPCPLTALRRNLGTTNAASSAQGAGVGGLEEGGLWPAPAKFYCCRADLVAAMAKEHTNNNESNAGKAAMDVDNDGGVNVDYDDDDDELEVAEEVLPDATFREVFDRSHQQDTDERWQVKEPDLPYVENLPHQLDAGRAIVIEGTVLPDALGFAINLTCGAGESPDIAFHLNPRLDRCYVARNSRSKGNWGQEEGAALGGSPFTRGKPFMIHILVTATGFKVSVDCMHFCNFQYRMPISKVCRLEIHGDVIVSTIQHTRLEVYPERPEHTFCTIPTDHAVPWSLDLSEKENLFIGRFKPNLSPGVEITVRGRMKLLPQSFYLNLQQGCQLWPHPNVHFHLNPRFAAEDSEHVVVVNGWRSGSWGSEQRYNRCRFRPGEPFSIVIYVEEQRYRVMVNGLQQAAMFHRAPPSLVDTLVVRGDLFINHVGISKSLPAAERLPSPGSPPESLSGSFVNIPEAASSHSAVSPESQSTDSESASPCRQPDLSLDSCEISRDILSSKPSTINEKPVTSSQRHSTLSENKSGAAERQDGCPSTANKRNDSLEVPNLENESKEDEKTPDDEATSSSGRQLSDASVLKTDEMVRSEEDDRKKQT